MRNGHIYKKGMGRTMHSQEMMQKLTQTIEKLPPKYSKINGHITFNSDLIGIEYILYPTENYNVKYGMGMYKGYIAKFRNLEAALNFAEKLQIFTENCKSFFTSNGYSIHDTLNGIECCKRYNWADGENDISIAIYFDKNMRIKINNTYTYININRNSIKKSFEENLIKSLISLQPTAVTWDMTDNQIICKESNIHIFTFNKDILIKEFLSYFNIVLFIDGNNFCQANNPNGKIYLSNKRFMVYPSYYLDMLDYKIYNTLSTAELAMDLSDYENDIKKKINTLLRKNCIYNPYIKK